MELENRIKELETMEFIEFIEFIEIKLVTENVNDKVNNLPNITK
ncbi:28846_t:CDS:1, partial [Dentiscutata erythropus]